MLKLRLKVRSPRHLQKDQQAQLKLVDSVVENKKHKLKPNANKRKNKPKINVRIHLKTPNDSKV